MPYVLVSVSVAIVVGFSATALLTAAHREHQRELARDWQERGARALEEGRHGDAVAALRNALRFDRGDRAVRLRLAQALAATDRTAEARAYLERLWIEQPGNGLVNLVLARLAARDEDTANTTRYYTNAIEGAWADTAEQRRRAVRFELSEYLLARGERARAEVALIGLAADPPADTDGQVRVATLLGEAGAPRRALSVFEQILKADPKHVRALVGAGQAAFTLNDFTAAARYLSRVPADRLPEPAADQLAVAELVMALDPYRRGLSAQARGRRARLALQRTSARMDACLAEAQDLEPLRKEIAAARKTASARALARDAERLDAVMDLVYRTVDTIQQRCTPPEAIERALLVIASRSRPGGP